MFRKRQIFKISALKKLLTEANSCVTLVTCTRALALPPYFLNDVKAGIIHLLNGILKKYDRTLGGIPIGYQNITILLDGETGKIHLGSAETEVNIRVEFYVFQPRIGSNLEGVVNKKSNNHIGCLVHRYFNATILKPEDVNYEDWICKDYNIDDKIVFKVKELNFSGFLPYIEGIVEDGLFNKLRPNSDSNNCDLETKIKKLSEEILAKLNQTSNCSEQSSSPSKNKNDRKLSKIRDLKKDKKRKHFNDDDTNTLDINVNSIMNENLNEANSSNNNNDSTVTKKRKKHKSVKSTEVKEMKMPETNLNNEEVDGRGNEIKKKKHKKNKRKDKEDGGTEVEDHSTHTEESSVVQSLWNDFRKEVNERFQSESEVPSAKTCQDAENNKKRKALKSEKKVKKEKKNKEASLVENEHTSLYEKLLNEARRSINLSSVEEEPVAFSPIKSPDSSKHKRKKGTKKKESEA